MNVINLDYIASYPLLPAVQQAMIDAIREDYVNPSSQHQLGDKAAEVLAGRRLGANVDLYAPIVLEGCGIPRSSFTPTFAVARIVGWCAHILEQATERKVIRPAAHYVGEPYDGESPY